MYSWIKQEITKNSIKTYDLIAKEDCQVKILMIYFDCENIIFEGIKEKIIVLRKNQSLCLRGHYQNIVVLDDYPSTYYYNNTFKNIKVNYKEISDKIKVKDSMKSVNVNYNVKVEHDDNVAFISETLIKL